MVIDHLHLVKIDHDNKKIYVKSFPYLKGSREELSAYKKELRYLQFVTNSGYQLVKLVRREKNKTR